MMNMTRYEFRDLVSQVALLVEAADVELSPECEEIKAQLVATATELGSLMDEEDI